MKWHRQQGSGGSSTSSDGFQRKRISPKRVRILIEHQRARYFRDHPEEMQKFIQTFSHNDMINQILSDSLRSLVENQIKSFYGSIPFLIRILDLDAQHYFQVDSSLNGIPCLAITEGRYQEGLEENPANPNPYLPFLLPSTDTSLPSVDTASQIGSIVDPPQDPIRSASDLPPSVREMEDPNFDPDWNEDEEDTARPKDYIDTEYLEEISLGKEKISEEPSLQDGADLINQRALEASL